MMLATEYSPDHVLANMIWETSPAAASLVDSVRYPAAVVTVQRARSGLPRVAHLLLRWTPIDDSIAAWIVLFACPTTGQQADSACLVPSAIGVIATVLPIRDFIGLAVAILVPTCEAFL